MPWGIGLAMTLVVGASVLAALSRVGFAPFALVPQAVWRGEIWRLATWPLVQPSPIGLVFGCLALYWFGGPLAGRWGSGVLLRVLGALLAAASVGTCLVGLVDRGVWHSSTLGLWAPMSALVVAWGLSFPYDQVRIYWVIPVRGYVLAWLTVALTVLYVVYGGLGADLAQLIAVLGMLAWVYRARLPRMPRVRWAPARERGTVHRFPGDNRGSDGD